MGEGSWSQSNQPKFKTSLVGRKFSLVVALGISWQSWVGTLAPEGLGPGWGSGPPSSFGPKTKRHFVSLALNVLPCQMVPVQGGWGTWPPTFSLPHILHTSHFRQEVFLVITSGPFPPQLGQPALTDRPPNCSFPGEACCVLPTLPHHHWKPEAAVCMAWHAGHSLLHAVRPCPCRLATSQLSHCFSVSLPLSTLKHRLSPGFCPWPSYGLRGQLNLISVLKAQPFLLSCKICKSRCPWIIFIYLRFSVPQIKPFIFLPKLSCPSILCLRDWHLLAPTIQKSKEPSKIPLLLHLSYSSGHKTDFIL